MNSIDKIQFEKNISTRFDIVSNLIARNLNSIVQRVFLRLHELDDVFNATEANPKWVDALNSKTWLNQYFAKNHQIISSSRLKMIMHKTWQQKRETHTSSTILKEAFSSYSKLTKNAVIRPEDGAAELVHAVDSLEWLSITTDANDEYIVVLLSSHYRCLTRKICTLLVYDKWTLELVNGVSVYGGVADAHEMQFKILEDDSALIVLSIRKNHHPLSFHIEPPDEAFVFNPATGSARTVQLKHVQMERCSNLVFLYTSLGTDNVQHVSVYKLDINDGDGELSVTRPKDSELSVDRYAVFMRANPNLDYVGLYSNDIIEFRSKRDFSVIDRKRIPARLFWPRYLLSDTLVMGSGMGECFLEMRSLLDENLPKVFEFHQITGSWFRPLLNRPSISFTGGHLVATTSFEGAVMVWQLAPDFIEQCEKRAADGNFGIVADCLVFRRERSKDAVVSHHVDQFGITRIEHEYYDALAPGYHDLWYSKAKMTVGTHFTVCSQLERMVSP